MSDILFLAHRVPFPPNRGDKIRAHHLLKKLAKLGRVHVGCFAESDEDRAGATELEAITASYCITNRTKPLVLAGVEAMISREPVSLAAFRSAALKHWVRETIAAQNISTIVIFSGQMGQYVPDDFAGGVVIDLCDVDSAKFESYAAKGERPWLYNREGRLLAREEERLARRADATILISENEAELFKSRLQFPSIANVHVMGNGIDARFFDPEVVEPHAEIAIRPGPHFVFTGQMDYPPNEAAALWTIREFLPAIRKRHPAAEFHVVGRSPTEKLRALAEEPGATVWGEVPDVRPFIAAATSVVTPLTIARGVQNKVLEAMAMARPVVLTQEAATGIAAQNGKDWLISAADPQAMCDRIEELLANPKTSCEMGKAAREFVLDQHDWDAMLSPLEGLIAAELEASHAA